MKFFFYKNEKELIKCLIIEEKYKIESYIYEALLKFVKEANE